MRQMDRNETRPVDVVVVVVVPVAVAVAVAVASTFGHLNRV